VGGSNDSMFFFKKNNIPRSNSMNKIYFWEFYNRLDLIKLIKKYNLIDQILNLFIKNYQFDKF
jgi:hypothetical protein